MITYKNFGQTWVDIKLTQTKTKYKKLPILMDNTIIGKTLEIKKENSFQNEFLMKLEIYDKEFLNMLEEANTAKYTSQNNNQLRIILTITPSDQYVIESICLKTPEKSNHIWQKSTSIKEVVQKIKNL